MLLRLLQAEELEGYLLQIPTVLDGAEAGGDLFEIGVLRWLSELEDILMNNRLPLASRVALASAMLTVAMHPPPVVGQGGARTNRRPARRDRAAACVRTLDQTVGELHAELASTLARLTEADAVCRRCIAVARHKGLIASIDPEDPHGLQHLMDVMRADPDVSAGVVQMDALLGPQDSLIVLSRRLSDFD
jgi:hypothetical protein